MSINNLYTYTCTVHTHTNTHTHNKTIFQMIHNIKFNAVEIGFDQKRNNLERLYELFQAIIYILYVYKLLFCEIIHRALSLSLPRSPSSLHKSEIMTCNSHSHSHITMGLWEGGMVRLYLLKRKPENFRFILYYFL